MPSGEGEGEGQSISRPAGSQPEVSSAALCPSIIWCSVLRKANEVIWWPFGERESTSTLIQFRILIAFRILIEFRILMQKKTFRTFQLPPP